MSLGHTFRTSLYGTVIFAAAILGRAEEGYLTPYLTILVAAFGWYLTEPPRQFGTPGWLSNVFGLIAVLASAIEFFGDNPEGRLLSGSHLIVYVTWIVLLQPKAARQYWTLLGLSILQVAVASVLTSGGWFGVSLVAFNTLAMWTLAVFSLYEADLQFGQAVLQSGSHEAVLAGPVSLLSAGLPKGLWYDRPADTRSTMHYDVERRWLTARFAGGVFSLSVMSLLIGSMFFLLIPRMWIGQPLSIGDGRDGAIGRRKLTGFSAQVRLGDLGQILESSAPVLSLRLYDALTDQPVDMSTYTARQGGDEPLFRGAVLTSYSDGRWEADQSGAPAQKRPLTWNFPGVRQEIVLEPIGTDVLFCLGQAEAVRLRNSSESAFWFPTTGLAVVEESQERHRRFTYTVFSRWPDAEPFPPRFPVIGGGNRLTTSRGNLYLDRLRELPQNQLDRLRSLARQVTDNVRQQRPGHVPTELELARALESHLRDSGLYGYSLALDIKDPAIDPVEDFLFNRQQGNCEYFATALTLMLRAEGIPARLVTGFKGGEINPLSGSFEVQQRHAHSWVEASLGGSDFITLDATPAVARSESVRSLSPSVSFWGWIKTLGTGFWDDYVVSVSLDRQQELIYQPLRSMTMQVVNRIKSLAAGLLAWFGVDQDFLSNPRNWFSLTGGVITAIVLLLVSAALWLIRWTWHRIRSLWRRREATVARHHRFVAFYDRFCRLLKGAGLAREPAVTPEEFAVAATERLQPALAAAGLAAFPLEITRWFYSTRFGEAPPTEAELAELNLQLGRLEQALATTRGPSAASHASAQRS